MTRQHMLIIEDDEKLRRLLSEYFINQGFDVTTLEDGSHAVSTMCDTQPDIVLLDLMLPVTDGLTICRQSRNQFRGKILILTASNDDFDHVAGLEIGADDYVMKPIKPRVLLARVRSLLRRPSHEMEADPEIMQLGLLRLENKYKRCELDGEVIQLTDSEFDLLWILASHPDQVMSRDELTRALRGIEYDGIDRTVDNKIVRLRKLLNDSQEASKRILTIRGKGYLFASTAWS
ncbi:response regulator [Pseudoalteromonas sp. XMcav2-N]|nr:response regulator [Pseudoalteromonas sp. XMcav2-N]